MFRSDHILVRIQRLLIGVYLCSSAAYCDVLIRDVTVIDVAKGTTTPKRSILIRGDKIATLGSEIPTGKHVEIVNGAGKFILPGFWDMHVHLARRDELPLYLAYGVTGVRDMGSDYERVKAWRTEVEKSQFAGPHIETCGPLVDGFPSTDPNLPVKMIRSPAEARALFDHLDGQQVDFIGVSSRLPREAYFALIERARKYYSLVAGDVPATVSVLEAIDARQKSIEHMSGILLACSTEERRLREPLSLALDRGDLDGFRQAESIAFDTFSPQKADVLFERMARFETRSVPTLVKLRVSPYEKGLYDKLTQVLMRMQRNGVAIMAGTDSGEAGTHPGEELHQELELLVAAGLTPAQALRSATMEPAKYIGADERLGAVSQGRVADLVLLDGNPLADIRNTRKIDGVVLGGKYFSKLKLNALRGERPVARK